MDNPIVKMIVIVLAVIGALAVASILGMLFMHGSMMSGMFCGEGSVVSASIVQYA